MSRLRRFRQLFGLTPKADVDAELAFHLEMRIRELVEQGETHERARERAMQRFGDYEGARTECVAINQRRKRQIERTEFIMELRQDVQSQLFSVSVFDPLTLTAVILVLLASAAIASLLPARRAAGVDPATAFRQR